MMTLKELVLLYRKLGYGDVSKIYSNEEENKFYNLVSSKLAEKYPKFVNYQEAYDLLKDNGRIVTINTPGQKGFYDDKRNIIGIKHFLDRLTTTIFHEIVHKLSYLIGNGKISKLPEVYREAGTEYITAETLKTKTAKACVFSNIWGKFPNTISSYYLDYVFVKQLNAILGGDALEESILKGNLSFEDRMKQYFGISKYDEITKKIGAISKDFFYYSAFYNINSAKENRELRARLEASIDTVQDFILKEGFYSKIKGVQTPEEANSILDTLLEFSELRLRTREDGKFVDTDFEEFFYGAKQEFSLRFPKERFKQKFIPDDWKVKYPDLEKVVEIPAEEKRKVVKMGKENYKKYREPFIKRIFGVFAEDSNNAVSIRQISSNSNRNFDEELIVKNVPQNKEKVPINKAKKTKLRDVR